MTLFTFCGLKSTIYFHFSLFQYVKKVLLLCLKEPLPEWIKSKRVPLKVKLPMACFHKEVAKICNWFLNILALTKQFVMIWFVRKVGSLRYSFSLLKSLFYPGAEFPVSFNSYSRVCDYVFCTSSSMYFYSCSEAI